MRSIMHSSRIKGWLVLVAVLAIGASGCRTVGTAGRSAGEAAGSTAEAAGGAAGTAARGAGDVIGDTAEEADRELD
jgi:hypothetical protein